MKKLSFILFLLLSTLTFAQHECGFDEIRMMGLMDIEDLPSGAYSGNRDQIFTIPVVFHVIHLGEEVGVGSNISDEQILDALRIVNEDLRKIPGSWGDGDGVDVEIELCLATRDPNGNPTNGINRFNGSIWPDYVTDGIETDISLPGMSEVTIKQTTSWNRAHYMNVWLVSEINGNNGTWGTQGYAYYPNTNIKDGIVLLNNVFGSIGTVKPTHNRSRTFTHEVGHYFGLLHTFEGYNSCDMAALESTCDVQGDRVCDTPPTVTNYACIPSCEETNSQYQNYMDYTNQLCRNMFTQGQKNRMRGSNGLFSTSRVTLLDSQGCVPVDAVNLAITDSRYYVNCGTPTIIPEIKIQNTGGIDVYEFQVQCSVEGTGYSVIETWVSETPMTPNQDILITFPSVSTTYSTGNILFNIISEDSYIFKNSTNLTYQSVPGEEFTLLFQTDVFEHESTWKVTNNTGAVIWSGGPYDDFNQTNVHIKCIPNGCYTFTVYDSFQDGLFPGGFFELSNSDGTTVAYGSGNFGGQISFIFCVNVPIVGPCEDLNTNWVCDYDEVNIIVGCMDQTACNFNPDATVDSNECYFSGQIYDCNGSCFFDLDMDGICDELEVYGCTDTTACNYNLFATENFGCEYSEPGYSCGGIPMSSLNTIMGIEELQEFHLIKEIRIFDATGRDLDPSMELSSGIYLIQIRFLNGELESHKVFLN